MSDKPKVVRLQITGMSCSNCRRKIEGSLLGITGVVRVSVDVGSGFAEIDFGDGEVVPPEQLVRAVSAVGFSARFAEVQTDLFRGFRFSGFSWRVNSLVSTAVALFLLASEAVFQRSSVLTVAIIVVSALNQILCGWRFYSAAWGQVSRFRANMDVLVSLGSSAAFLFSILAVVGPSHGFHPFFAESAAIIGLISLGHWLEELATGKAIGALKALSELVPVSANRILPDGSVVDCPIGRLQVGDQVLIRPGDSVPADCSVLSGSSKIDEAMLTGEAKPVTKVRGDFILGGTTNLESVLRAEVRGLGKDSALGQIVDSVRRAQSSKGQVQRLADAVSSIFVPIVVFSATLSALLWAFRFDWIRAVSEGLSTYLWHPMVTESPFESAVAVFCAVLIVACPCAMGLATPAAIMAGTSVGARRGILFRDAKALEQAGNITHILFDKTGTLTVGTGVVVDWRSVDGEFSSSLPEWAVVAGQLAFLSSHPLSQAIHRWSGIPSEPELGLFTKFREFSGKGLESSIKGGRTLRLGSDVWMKELKLRISAGIGEFQGRHSATGASLVFFAIDDEVVGAVAVRDQCKPEAASMIAALRRKGFVVGLLSGDKDRSASLIGAELGFGPDEIRSEMSPLDKASYIASLKQTGSRVAFVGDGINDGPALAEANLGIAVSKANHVAKEAAGIVLVNADILKVPEVIQLSRIMLRTIRQNLFWAFFYNAVAVPLAAVGFLHPLLCAASMGASDLMVIGNALRLLRFRAVEWRDSN